MIWNLGAGRKMFSVCHNCDNHSELMSLRKIGGQICTDVCYDASSLPTGMRTLSDQATIVYKDGSMQELTRQSTSKSMATTLNLSW